MRGKESFDTLLMEILGPHAVARAIYLIDHHRVNQVPKEMRQQIGILLSRKWAKGLVLKEKSE